MNMRERGGENEGERKEKGERKSRERKRGR